MTTLFTFPGQGVQKAGMLAALMQQTETLSVLEAANASFSPSEP